MNKKLELLIKDKNIQKQFFKYLLVGGSTAVLELAVFTFLRKVVYLDITISNVTAAVLATFLNFLINRGWSFKAASNLYRSMVFYIILFCVNTFFSTNFIKLMVSINVPDIFAKFITMCMITLWNFVLYRKVVFK